MKFTTPGNSSPQGKPKIYFTGHPDDCKIYFHEIVNSIIKLCDCAVFYDEDPEHPENIEDFTADLGNMQLVVLIVTENYIVKDTFAHNTVFTNAIERHIPVLPILISADIAEDFNKKCGDLQCLVLYSRDNTEISYTEKLKRFLEEKVLIGDKLAKQVREAFDTYIFLSYRKKDRRYAQELMRLIHSNDFCRDIAIWYDEFLVPGENFNEAIHAAMEKSELFALAVTPNLLENPNYIMTEEYPAARVLGKKVLPAMLVPTDENKLREHYEKIPELINPKDSKAMRDTLGKMLENIAKRENNDDPKHNFFIGLAYLDGIDVEIDFDRAVSLITSAAEAKLPEALKKLVSMYRTGKGVKRDYKKSIKYQFDLVDVYAKEFDAEQSEENGKKSVEEIRKLGNYVYESGNISGALDIRKEQLDLCLDFRKRWNKDWVSRFTAESYNDLGDIYRQIKLSKAKKLYEKALEISEKLAKQFGTLDLQRDLFVGYFKLGDVYRMQDDFSQAQKFYEKALEISERLAKQFGTLDLQRDLFVGYFKLGDVYHVQGRNVFRMNEYLPKAQEYYEKASEIAETLAKQLGTPESQRDLSLCYTGFGDVCKTQHHSSEARKFYIKAIEISEKIAEQFGTPESQRDLLCGYGKLGTVCEMMNNFSEAQNYYEKAFEIAEKLTKLLRTPESWRELSGSYDAIGNIYKKQKDFSKARQYYDKSAEIFDKLAKQLDTPRSWGDLSEQYIKLGEMCQEWGEPSIARDYYEKALKFHVSLAEQLGTLESQQQLSLIYASIGCICIAQGDLSEAQIFLIKSIETKGCIAEQHGKSIVLQTDLSGNYLDLGGICKTLGNISEARKYYEKAVEINSELVEHSPPPFFFFHVYDSLAVSFHLLSTVSEPEEKKRCLLECERLWSILLKKYPDDEPKLKSKLEMVRKELG